MTTLITGHVEDPTRVSPLTADEALIYSQLRSEGVLTQGFWSQRAPQFVGFSELNDLEALEAALWRLPFVAQGVMALRFQEVRPLPMTRQRGDDDAQL